MINKKQLNELTKLYPVLLEIDEKLLGQALSKAKIASLKAGTPIFDELQSCVAFPFILSGNIRVYKRSVNGRELSLYNVTPGDACVVTAGCLLGDKPYNASGYTKEDTIAVMMPSCEFERLLSSKVFREFVFSLFSKRILELMQLVEEVAFERLDRRLASLLLQKGKYIKMSHQQLSDELGTVREMISRLLKNFSETDLVAISRGQIRILDEAGLKYILES